MKKAISAIILSGLWITLSEFFRNEFLFKNIWVGYYNSLGLKFTTTAVNGLLWMVWSFTLAFIIFKLLSKFSLAQTIFISWLAAFFMMWLTIYNLRVLPLPLLIGALPLSLLEICLAGLIIKKIS